MTTDTREENHAISNAKGWSETITALVAALSADYDRLEELRDERAALFDEANPWRKASEMPAEYTCGCGIYVHPSRYSADAEHAEDCKFRQLVEWDEENGEELRELVKAVTVDGDEMKDAEAAAERIQEAPLAVSIRSGWYRPGVIPEPEEFEILLSTGGPALRIRGELNEHKEPSRAWLEWQDWGTPWTEFHGEGAPSQDDLITFASSFFFGE